MAQYALLIYEQAERSRAPELRERLMHEHGSFAGEVAELGGQVVGGSALETTATATTIRGTRGDAPTVTDGPFAETKEALGGFYLIEAADLDQALAIARRCPAPF